MHMIVQMIPALQISYVTDALLIFYFMNVVVEVKHTFLEYMIGTTVYSMLSTKNTTFAD